MTRGASTSEILLDPLAHPVESALAGGVTDHCHRRRGLAQVLAAAGRGGAR